MASKLPSTPGPSGTLKGGARDGAGAPKGHRFTAESAALARQARSLKAQSLHTDPSSYVHQALLLSARGYGTEHISQQINRKHPTVRKLLQKYPEDIARLKAELTASRQSFYAPHVGEASKALAEAFESGKPARQQWAADRTLDGYFGRVGYDGPPPTAAVQVNISFGSTPATPVTVEHKPVTSDD